MWGYVFIHTPEYSIRKPKKFIKLAPRCKVALGAWRSVRVPESLVVSSAFSTPGKAKKGDGIVAAAAAKNQGRLLLFLYLRLRCILFVCFSQGLFPMLVFRSATAAGCTHASMIADIVSKHKAPVSGGGRVLGNSCV